MDAIDPQIVSLASSRGPADRRRRRGGRSVRLRMVDALKEVRFLVIVVGFVVVLWNLPLWLTIPIILGLWCIPDPPDPNGFGKRATTPGGDPRAERTIPSDPELRTRPAVDTPNQGR